ncbi:MAG: TonB-dependent receptor [Caldimonas sp.]
MGGFEHASRAPRGGTRRLARACALGVGVGLFALAASAQGTAGEPPAPGPAAAPAPRPAPAAPAAPSDAAPKTEQLAPVNITGSRADDVQERRQSTAAKIIIGREEIDRFGDATLGDVLKRLPGVTIQGRPGRGGAIRLRGLGNGYTQILLDGERVPPGFSLDSLSPDQIERIEILRAPTAETGARAIAGTINVITREGYIRRANDLRLNASLENGKVGPSASWTRNLSAGAWTINYSLSAYHFERDNSSTTTTTDTLDDGTVTLAQSDAARVPVQGSGIHANGRLQWRSDGGIDTVTLTPVAYYNRGSFVRHSVLTQSVGTSAVPYDTAAAPGEYASSVLRLNGQWNRRISSSGRLEWRAGIGQSRAPSSSSRTEFTQGEVSRTLDSEFRSRDSSATSSIKWVESIFDGHSLVSGAEVESNRRKETSTVLQDGELLLTDEFGDSLSASSLRFAAYLQDEWDLSPHWSAHAGLRWESITTRGSVAKGEPDVRNRSSVWTPLLHAVWKPDPKGRDQVRFSLTRSYRSPPLQSLIARPAINARYPIPGPNTPTQPDRAGNPELKPELATGIDIAVERYLPGSGLISANVFRRNISNYMRGVTMLETVSYASSPRYVLRQQNVGDAVTQGLELETKLRLSDLWEAAPRIDVRANASFFRSRVKEVPGPDNRLDQQPDYTANLGLDYRLRGLPLMIGGNLNWTPGYSTRLSQTQTTRIGRKLVADVYGLWTLGPSAALRVTASNLAAADYIVGGAVDASTLQDVAFRETSQTTSPTYINLQVRLELKI